MVTRVSSLIDGKTGKPIEYDVDLLSADITTPVLGGIRSIMDGHPAQGLDPIRLTNILRAAENGNALAQHELAEEIEEKDLHYQGTLGTRKRAVAQLDITVDAASDDEGEDQANAQLIRDWIDRDTLEDELFDMLDAIGKGFSVTEAIWTIGDQWLPECLERADQRFFEYSYIDGKTLLLKGGAEGMSGMPTPLPAFKYIVHNHPAKSGLPIRGGLIRGVAWCYLFKNIALKDWTIFAEIYGQPYRVGKYDPSSTPDERAKLLRAVQSIGVDAAAIIPASMVIDFVKGAASGDYEVYAKLLGYLDDQESKAVLGQTGTTDAKAGGIGSGSANVHNEVRGDIKRSDAKKLAATLNKTVVRWIVDFNNGPPASGKYPRISIGAPDLFTTDDMEMLEAFVDMGGEVEMAEIRNKLGYRVPPQKTKSGEPVKLLIAASKTVPPLALPAEGNADVAANSTSRLLGPLKSSYEPVAALRVTSRAAPTDQGDAIDGLVDAGADQWVPVVAPAIDSIVSAAEASTSFDDFKTRLAALPDSIKLDAITDLLARTLFNARLAGEAGMSPTGGDNAGQ